MRYIVIAAHGTMATGMQKSIEMICGQRENVTYINFYVEHVDYNKIIHDYMDAHDKDDEIIICTDMWGGSVSQKFLPYLTQRGTHMIVGINLPIVLELIFFEESLTREVIDEFIRTGREQLHYVDKEKFISNNTVDFF